MKIKKVKLEDWRKLRDLYLKLLESDPDSFVDEAKDVSLRTEEEWVRDLKRDGATFVAIENEKFVGMGRINFYSELPKIPVLHKLGVLPEYRKKGFGNAILEARENWAKNKGAKKIRTYVIDKNKKIINFLKKQNYYFVKKEINSSKRKDGTTVDVVIMEKDL